MIPQLIVAIIAGVAAHQAKPFIERLDTTSQTVRNLSNYSIGYLAIGAVFEIFMMTTDLPRRDKWVVSAVFWLSGVFVGLGVFLGYVIDSVTKK